jgi:hypothetical protein
MPGPARGERPEGRNCQHGRPPATAGRHVAAVGRRHGNAAGRENESSRSNAHGGGTEAADCGVGGGAGSLVWRKPAVASKDGVGEPGGEQQAAAAPCGRCRRWQEDGRRRLVLGLGCSRHHVCGSPPGATDAATAPCCACPTCCVSGGACASPGAARSKRQRRIRRGVGQQAAEERGVVGWSPN